MNRFARIASAAALSVLVLTGASCTMNQSQAPSSATQSQQETASVVLNFGPANKTQKQFAMPVTGQKTALDLLKDATSANGLSLVYSNSSFGAYITEIDGVKSTANQFWLVYLNDKSIEVAADKQAVVKGDKIEFRFEQSK